MKDYRYEGVYNSNEWEDSKEWRARRLQFLWDFRLYFCKEYMDMKMFEEKNQFYSINDDEVSRLAAKYDSYSDGELERYKTISIEKLSEEYDRLKDLKNCDRKQFFMKNNSNLYCFITQHKLEELEDYKMNR